jgi:hypothetical protein
MMVFFCSGNTEFSSQYCRSRQLITSKKPPNQVNLPAFENNNREKSTTLIYYWKGHA